MNVIVKSAIAAALSVSASGAFAIGLPSTNSSDLILIVENTSTTATYALDTGISINSIFPTSGVTAGTVLGTSIAGITTSLAVPSTLSTFLSANPASGDSYTIEAGQYNGNGTATSNNSNSNKIGDAKMVFSSSIGTINPQVVSNYSLGNLENFNNGLSGSLNSPEELNGLTTSTSVTGNGIYTNQASLKYGNIGATDLEKVGTADSLFGFTGNAHGSIINSYVLGTVNLGSDGTLTITGNGGGGTGPAPVPLPAAVWLFGSGLMGLIGVSRRRKAAAVAAV